MATESMALAASGGGDPRLVGLALLFAGIAAVILVWYLIRRPPLTPLTKVVMFFGLGAFPIAASGAGNLVGFQQTTTRDFCSGCHVMEPYTDDAADRSSDTLAARHSRNHLFGDSSCYTCHADYGMYGTVLTKMNGLKHVYHYYTHYEDLTVEEALPILELYQPYPNENCMQCHSTTLHEWRDVPDHEGLTAELEAESVSCVSRGCHGPAHPFSKKARVEAKAAGKEAAPW